MNTLPADRAARRSPSDEAGRVRVAGVDVETRIRARTWMSSPWMRTRLRAVRQQPAQRALHLEAGQQHGRVARARAAASGACARGPRRTCRWRP